MCEQKCQLTDHLIEEILNYLPTVYQICLGFTKNPSDAEDLTQEVYLRAHRKLNSLRRAECFKHWIIQITRNTCLNHVRRQKIIRFFPISLFNQPLESRTPEVTLINKEQRQAFKKAVEELPIKWREVFILREYGHLSYEEISFFLQIKKGTIMSRLNRARNAVLTQIEETYE